MTLRSALGWLVFALAGGVVAMGQDVQTRPGTPPVGGAAAPAGPTIAPATPALSAELSPDGASLAARSLYHSAIGVVLSAPSTADRAGRLVALAEMALRLAGRDGRANLLMADIRESQQQPAQAADHMEAYLQSAGQDYQAWLRLMGLRLAALNSADERLALTGQMLESQGVPQAVRAVAGAELARLLLATGDRGGALKALQQARDLDRCQAAVLQAWLALARPDRVQEVAAVLDMMRGQPRDPSHPAQLAALLDEAGLVRQGAAFAEFSWQLQVRRKDLPVSHDFLANYLNVMLDAGRAARAIEVAGDAARPFDRSAGVLSLMHEAYEQAGRKEQAGQTLAQMRALYAGRNGQDAASLIQQAWFHILSDPQPERAMSLALTAARLEGKDPLVRRVLSGARLWSDSEPTVMVAVADLEALADSDPYAAWLLARFYVRRGLGQQAQQVLDRLGPVGAGPALRQLRQLAGEHNLRMPVPSDQKAILDALAAFDQRYLEMALKPGEFVEISLRADRQELGPGEPVELTAVLRNTSDVEAPLGPWGLTAPSASVRVRVGGQTFQDAPRIVWPAPRCLPPGGQVQAVVRIDAGRLGEFLADRPLEELVLSVQATAGTAAGNDEGAAAPATSPAPPPRAAATGRADVGDVTSAPIRITRRALGQDAGGSLEQTLGERVGSRDLAQRMMAARQIASLVRMAQPTSAAATQAAADQAAPQAASGQGWPVELARGVMSDPSPAVRAELPAALVTSPLDAQVLAVLRPAVADPSPLVRLRMAELIGQGSADERPSLLRELGQDADPLVALMARAFQGR